MPSASMSIFAELQAALARKGAPADEVFEDTVATTATASPAQAVEPQQVDNAEVDNSHLFADWAFQQFVGRRLDVNALDFSDNLEALLEEKKDYEVVHGAAEATCESFHERLKRLRIEIPQTIATVQAIANMEDDDEGEDNEAGRIQQLNASATAQLRGAEDDMRRVVATSDGLQKRLFGPAEASTSLYDPWTPMGYVANATIVRDITETTSTKATDSPTEPLLQIDDVNMCQSMAWSVNHNRTKELATRLRLLETEVCGRGVEFKKTESTMLETIEDLHRRLVLMGDGSHLSKLTQTMTVMQRELDQLEGRGLTDDKIDPLFDDWRPEKQVEALYASLSTEAAGFLSGESDPDLPTMLTALKCVEASFRQSLSLLKSLDREETRTARLKTMILSDTESVAQMKELQQQRKTAVEVSLSALRQHGGGVQPHAAS